MSVSLNLVKPTSLLLSIPVFLLLLPIKYLVSSFYHCLVQYSSLTIKKQINGLNSQTLSLAKPSIPKYKVLPCTGNDVRNVSKCYCVVHSGEKSVHYHINRTVQMKGLLILHSVLHQHFEGFKCTGLDLRPKASYQIVLMFSPHSLKSCTCYRCVLAYRVGVIQFSSPGNDSKIY